MSDETPNTPASEATSQPSADDTQAAHGHARPAGEAPGWFEEPAHIKKMLRVFWICCGLLLIPDVLEGIGLVHFKHPHEGFWWESWVGFFAFYGFVACVVLVLIAKQIRKVIMRDEDYYDED